MHKINRFRCFYGSLSSAVCAGVRIVIVFRTTVCAVPYFECLRQRIDILRYLYTLADRTLVNSNRTISCVSVLNDRLIARICKQDILNVASCQNHIRMRGKLHVFNGCGSFIRRLVIIELKNIVNIISGIGVEIRL